LVEVIILWPNAPCPCLKEAVQAYEAGDQCFSDIFGDLNLEIIRQACLNSIPVSSYHYRLWTKQEFLFARSISLYHCSRSAGRCSRDAYDWSERTFKLSFLQQENLGVWARWKYGQCVEQVADHRKWTEEAAWSLFSESYTSGIDNLRYAIFAFNLTKDLDSHEHNLNFFDYLSASFLLSNKLEGEYAPLEDRILFNTMHGSYTATVKNDFVVAIMLQLKVTSFLINWIRWIHPSFCMMD
jgi:hypothetical protein